jgi:hypothetical protein
VLGGLDQRRDERHRGGAAADDDDALAGNVEVVGPALGVHDRAEKRSMRGKSGR